MNFSKRRQEIRHKYFSTGGLIATFFMGLLGLIFLYECGIFSTRNIDSLFDCIFDNIIIVSISLLFIGITIYCWIEFFLNIVIRPKKEVLYLKKDIDNNYYFVSEKGKQFKFDNKNKLNENSYYYVLKTKNYIYEVLEQTHSNWNSKVKKSYWLNFYSSFGNYENILLLPIFYVFLLSAIVIFIRSNGISKIFGAIFLTFIIYIIGYDLIYKIKMGDAENDLPDGSKFAKVYSILYKSVPIISAIILCAIFIFLFSIASNTATRIILLPFILFSFCAFGIVVSEVLSKYKLKEIFFKVSLIIFLIFMFGLIAFWNINLIKNGGDIIYCCLSVPFWIMGFSLFYKYIIKK